MRCFCRSPHATERATSPATPAYLRVSCSRKFRWWARSFRRDSTNLVTHIAVDCAAFFLSFLFLILFLFSRRLLSAALDRPLVARQTLQLRNIDPVQNRRQLTGAQLDRTRSLLHSRQLEYSRFQPFVPKACSRQNAVTVCPLRACSETGLRHFVHAFFERLVMS
jgi:hypothetical protein